MIELTLFGELRGKGRPRFSVARTKTGHALPKAYTDRKTVEYERAIRRELIKKYGKVEQFPDDIPLGLHVVAYYQIPPSYTKKKKEACAAGTILPTKKPDGDNILKIIADGMQRAGLFKDDKNIINWQLTKSYTEGPERAEVTLWEVKP